jgi:hypothetical protein
VSPQPQAPSGAEGEGFLCEAAAHAVPSGGGFHDELGAAPGVGVGGIDVGVADELVLLVREHVTHSAVTEVTEVERGVLRQRADAVELGGVLDEERHPRDLVVVEPRDDLYPGLHRCRG